MLDKFAVLCVGCGSKDVEVALGDNYACGDPKCCGETIYYIVITCKTCSIYEEIRD